MNSPHAHELRIHHRLNITIRPVAQAASPLAPIARGFYFKDRVTHRIRNLIVTSGNGTHLRAAPPRVPGQMTASGNGTLPRNAPLAYPAATEEFAKYRAAIDAKIMSRPRRGKVCCFKLQSALSFDWPDPLPAFDRLASMSPDGRAAAGWRWEDGGWKVAVAYSAAADCSSEPGRLVFQHLYPQRDVPWELLHNNGTKGGERNFVWDGEFGTEIQVVNPWLYGVSEALDCDLNITGLAGTRYVYWFAPMHRSEGRLQRSTRTYTRSVPLGCPLSSTHDWPHFRPEEPRSRVGNTTLVPGIWTPAPFKAFFEAGELELFEPGDTRPLLVVFNKHTKQWGQPPLNFIDIDDLRRIFNMVEPLYRIVYVRLENKALEDITWHNRPVAFDDKPMIRQEFPRIIIIDDLIASVDSFRIDDHNLLVFGLCARSQHFISVQGGNSALASYFGGENIVLVKAGREKEGKAHDMQWYYLFGGAKVWHTPNSDAFLLRIRERFAPGAAVPISEDRVAAVERNCQEMRGPVNAEHSYQTCSKQ